VNQLDRIKRFFRFTPELKKHHHVSEKKQMEFFNAVSDAFYKLGVGGQQQAQFDYSPETGVFCVLIQMAARTK